jgi:hypothetical protein
MRRLITICVVMLAAGVVCARPDAEQLQVPLGTNTSGSATIGLSGYLDAVYVSVSDGASTGSVAVSYAPLVGSTAVNLATNSVVGEKVWRPMVDVTDVAGAGLTSDEPIRYVIAGETVTFAVSGSPTGLIWKCVLVIDED